MAAVMVPTIRAMLIILLNRCCGVALLSRLRSKMLVMLNRLPDFHLHIIDVIVFVILRILGMVAVLMTMFMSKLPLVVFVLMQLSFRIRRLITFKFLLTMLTLLMVLTLVFVIMSVVHRFTMRVIFIVFMTRG